LGAELGIGIMLGRIRGVKLLSLYCWMGWDSRRCRGWRCRTSQACSCPCSGELLARSR
jgi:hypothetical protein